MATVSTTLPSDGQTIDAADVNTPINAILSEFNGNIDNDNIKSGAAISGSKIADASITNAKLSTTAGELGGAWADWTPSYTNLTIGSGTVTAKYTQIGKTVHFEFIFTYGSGSAVGTSPTFTLPVAITNGRRPTFSSYAYDDGTTRYALLAFATGTNLVNLFNLGTAGAYPAQANITSTAPMTWATGDQIFVSGTYEAA